MEYRAYRQGDDPKLIDWKLLARTNRVYIRLAHERTLMPTMVVVDGSASLAFPPESLAKWNLASRVAVALAAVARHGGDPVGLVVAQEGGLKAVAPSARRSTLDRMMRALDLTPAGRPPLGPAAAEAMRRGTRVVLISDFLDDTESLVASGRAFAAAGGELYAVHVVDRLELDPDPSKLLVEDPEAAAIRRPLSPSTRAAYLERFWKWRTQLATDWRNAGAVYTMVVPWAEPLRQVIHRITTRAAGSG